MKAGMGFCIGMAGLLGLAWAADGAGEAPASKAIQVQGEKKAGTADSNGAAAKSCVGRRKLAREARHAAMDSAQRQAIDEMRAKHAARKAVEKVSSSEGGMAKPSAKPASKQERK
jgi:hypothetical protein